MGINPTDFRHLVVRPTLEKLGRWSPSLENLLIGTAAQASGLGLQLKSDRGFGIYQLDAALHQTVWDCFFAFDADLASLVRGIASQREFLADPHLELATNMSYATAIAWGVYAHSGATLPDDPENVDNLAQCWYQSFCQDLSLTPLHFITNYRKLVQQNDAIAA